MTKTVQAFLSEKRVRTVKQRVKEHQEHTRLGTATYRALLRTLCIVDMKYIWHQGSSQKNPTPWREKSGKPSAFTNSQRRVWTKTEGRKSAPYGLTCFQEVEDGLEHENPLLPSPEIPNTHYALVTDAFKHEQYLSPAHTWTSSVHTSFVFLLTTLWNNNCIDMLKTVNVDKLQLCSC